MVTYPLTWQQSNRWQMPAHSDDRGNVDHPQLWCNRRVLLFDTAYVIETASLHQSQVPQGCIVEVGCLLEWRVAWQPQLPWRLEIKYDNMNITLSKQHGQVSDGGAKSDQTMLTHWGRVTHICVNKLTIIGSDNGLAPGRHQTIIWTNDGILLIGPLGC